MSMNTKLTVARADELKDGQMKEVGVQDRKILLVRFDGKYKAFVAQCPHHGAPLAEGVLHDGHVRCPWHQSVFDARNGKRIEPPALEGLPTYDCHVEGENVVVVMPQVPRTDGRETKLPGADLDADKRTFAILGAGAAGTMAAETLRRSGFRGRLVLISGEQEPAYDRTELSKRYLSSPDKSPIEVRSPEFYAGGDIELITGRAVREVQADQRRITFDDGESMTCDRLLLATGSRPRRLDVEGSDLDNIFTLRTRADNVAIRAAAEGARRALIVGASFIGMEVAASLTQRGLSVTVLAPEEVPFETILGRQIGQMLQQTHEDEGVSFHLGRKVRRFVADDGAVSAVELDDGQTVETDLVVVGIGVEPVTDYLRGVDRNEDGSVTVDSHMRLGNGLYAAGDIARFPDWRGGEPIRIEHWRVAQQLGRVSALNMAGVEQPYGDVPFFWTKQFSVILQHVGHCPEWDEIVFDGEPADGEFLGFYLVEGTVRAVSGCMRDWDIGAAAEALQAADPPTLDELRARMQRERQTQHA